MEILRGRLECITESREDGHCGHHYQFRTENGKVIENVIPHPDCPYEDFVEAVFEGKRMLYFTILIANEVSRTIRVAVVHVVRNDPTDSNWNRVNNACEALNYHYRRTAPLEWDFEALPFVLKSDCGRHLRSTCWGPIQNHVNSLTDENITHWHGSGGQGPGGIRGHAYTNGRYAWTYDNGDMGTYVHENGHNFNVLHAGTPTHEYGETDTIMGSGNNRRYFNVPHQIQMGTTTKPAKLITDSRHVILTRPDPHPLCVRPGEEILAEVQKPGHPRAGVSLVGDKIRIYHRDGSRWMQTRMLADLQKGQTWNDSFYVHYKDWKDGAAMVEIRNNPTVKANDNINFPDILVGDNREEISSGLWGHPDHEGQAFEIIKHEHGITAYWYGGTHRGNPSWHIAHGQIEDNIAKMELLSIDFEEVNKVGYLWFYVTDKDKYEGRIHAYIEGDGRYSFDVKAFGLHDGKYKAYEFKDNIYSGLTWCEYPSGGAGYVYMNAKRSIHPIPGFGSSRPADWIALASDGNAYKWRNVRRGIRTGFEELVKLGPYTKTETKLILPNEEFDIERVPFTNI